MDKRREIAAAVIIAILSFLVIFFAGVRERHPNTAWTETPTPAVRTVVVEYPVEVTREVRIVQTVPPQLVEVTREVPAPYPVYVDRWVTPTAPTEGKGQMGGRG